VSEFNLIIAGERRAAPSTFAVLNPATGRVYDHAPECTAALLDEAFAAAAKAQIAWKQDDEARRAALGAAAHKLFANGEELGHILTTEQGKPLARATEEVLAAGVWLKYYSALKVGPEVIQDDKQARAEVVRKPMGVVAAITPWNFPILLACWKIGPALRAGNTMVLKPSPYTPLSSLRMVEILNQVLPPGVLNVVSGGDDLGRLMTSHPTPRKITFTGSAAAGKQVAAAAAPDLKRVTLELGGNDPAILLDDVDPAAVADEVFWGAFMNSGQVCSAIKRIYAPDTIYEDVVEALAAKAAAVKMGDGFEDGVELGPINNAPQFERVKELVDDAISGGARVAAGGAALDGPGYFFQPTILANLTDGTRIVDEEQFGPAVPVISYRDIDEVVARANATNFGLSGSVWGTDTDRASAVAADLECGTAWVNAHVALAPHQPFGGFKWSGIGVENGPWGFAAFTEVQVQYRNKA
jgi:acyl-CoA reductase-like NAD-dependent aldehyde dehydrogenase